MLQLLQNQKNKTILEITEEFLGKSKDLGSSIYDNLNNYTNSNSNVLDKNNDRNHQPQNLVKVEKEKKPKIKKIKKRAVSKI